MNWEDAFAAVVAQASAEQENGTLTRDSLDAYIAEAKRLLASEAPGAIEVLINMRDSYGNPSPSYGNESRNPSLGQGNDTSAGDEPKVEYKAEGTIPDPEEEPQPEIPQLAIHDIDVPEEPETVIVVSFVWDPTTAQYVERESPPMLLVPSGCERPCAVSPYENTATLRSALPRDKQQDANLYAAYQTNGWTSRKWIQKRLDEDINPAEEAKLILDDIPLMLSLQGKPDPAAQVGQTAGLAPGDNNGAPLPPGPGPGRGNKFAAGDGLAKKPALPPNTTPGQKV